MGQPGTLQPVTLLKGLEEGISRLQRALWTIGQALRRTIVIGQLMGIMVLADY